MNRDIARTLQLRQRIETDGFAIVEDCIGHSTVEHLCASLDEKTYGQRNLLDTPAVQELARSRTVRRLMETVLGPDCLAVKGILFNKTPESNWKVVWHQDLTIAVLQHSDLIGFGRWTVKDGVPNVQPPAEILATILAIRIHLDENDLNNGPLRVVPGSHKHGRLPAEQIAALDKSQAVTCLAPRGGALLMRPLLLHASSACVSPQSRRVIHLEFTSTQLPTPIQWRWSIR